MGVSTIGSPSGVLHRLVAFRERFGAMGTLYKAIDVVLNKAFRTSIHTVVWLDVESLAAMASPDPRFTFRFLTADEVARYAADPAYYLDGSVAERVRQGRELCFGALEGDRLAAFGCYILQWNAAEQAGGVAMSYPPDVAYLAYGFTHPDFRGARLHGYIMSLALEELASRGITKLVSFVSWTNWASLKSCYRLGYVKLGNVIAVRVRRQAIGIYPKAAKRLGVRFGRTARCGGATPGAGPAVR